MGVVDVICQIRERTKPAASFPCFSLLIHQTRRKKVIDNWSGAVTMFCYDDCV